MTTLTKISVAAGSLIFVVIVGFVVMMIAMIMGVLSSMDDDHDPKETQNHHGATINGVKYAKIINKKANKYDISPALVAAVIKQESGFKVSASSSVGAIGLMQLMPGRCRDFGYSKSACKKPKHNIDAGSKILSGHLKKYDDDLKLALAAYNAGAGNVAKYHGDPPFVETQQYVKKIPKYYKQFKKKLKHGKIENDQGGNKDPGHFVYPIKGGKNHISSPFGMRWGRMHKGIDIAEPLGTPIYAAKKGKVILMKANPGGYGYYVDIKHKNGWVTRYGHMYPRTVKVNQGDKVKQGEKIAEIGSNGHSTGPHLHFEIQRPNRKATNPMPLLP